MKLSVITINFDNDQGLQRTIKSVLSQTYKDFEYIIIDGASTDNSICVIKNLIAKSNKENKWVSEPDSGIYEAMNKGIKIANGEYCHFLNSGDYLANDTVYETIFSKDYAEDIIYGNQINITEDQQILIKGYQKSELDFFDVFNGALFHSSAFIKRELFTTYGYYDESYKIVSDYIFFVKSIGFGNSSIRYVDLIICYFYCNGISSITKGEIADLHKKEDKRAIAENFPPRLLNLCINGQQDINMINILKKYKLIWFTARILIRLVTIYDSLKRRIFLYN